MCTKVVDLHSLLRSLGLVLHTPPNHFYLSIIRNRVQFNNWYAQNIRIDVFFWTAKYDVFSGLGFWSFVIIMEVFFFGISNRLIVIRWYRYSASAMEYYVVVDNFGFSLRNSFIFYFCVVISDLAWRITQFNKFLVISIECIF